MSGMFVAFCQRWEESERGWGVRPDGYSLHLTREGVDEYVRHYNNHLPDDVPDEYERPCGSVYPCEVSQELYDEIEASHCGVRKYDRTYPERI